MQQNDSKQPKSLQPKDLPFPRYARDYFNQLLQQYMLLLDKTGQQPPPPSIVQLITDVKGHPEATSWADVFALESAYLYAIPPERLPDEVQLARDRYRDVAGNDAYAAYAKTVPAALTGRTEADLRSELMTLAERIRYLYTFVPPKESLRNQIAIDAAKWTLGAAILGILIYTIFRLEFHVTVVTIVVVMFVGQMGGFLSVQQRLQASGNVDPLFKELQLINGWFSIVVIAPISGSIFAIVLYFMFAGGLMTGGLFPRFGPSPAPTPASVAATTFTATAAPTVGPATPATGTANTATPPPRAAPTPCPVDAYCSPLDITQFLERAAPTAIEDWGKLLVWAFIAGFAERFVPDVLTRLTGAKYSVGGDQQGSTPATRDITAKRIRDGEGSGTDGDVNADASGGDGAGAGRGPAGDSPPGDSSAGGSPPVTSPPAQVPLAGT
jgi:hypothetical protein